LTSNLHQKKLEEIGNPLVMVSKVIDFEMFRELLESKLEKFHIIKICCKIQKYGFQALKKINLSDSCVSI